MKSENIDRYKGNYIAIGLKISYYRKLRGFSQEQLAEKAGLSIGFLSQIEAPGMVVGVSLNTLFAISEVLEVPVHKFLEFDI